MLAGMDIEGVLRQQAGVISRAQAAAAGLSVTGGWPAVAGNRSIRVCT